MSEYPVTWEADVVLRDGATAHVRPIRPEDAAGIQDMHKRQSPESIYLRFFAALPEIPRRDLERFVNVDHHDRAALVMTIAGEIIGIARYDRIDANSAEVAFNIADAHQGRGIGSILLEHIADVARENGIGVFIAEVLPENRSMLQVFSAAGYEVSREFDDGVVDVHFDIDPTEKSIAVAASREHRAEALSVRALLHPASVAVIGASRKKNSTGHLLLRNLTSAGFTGRLHVIHPEADSVAGVPTVARLDDVTEPIDLAVVAVPAAAVVDVVKDCARHGVKGVVVISSGFAETGEDGAELQREVVSTARAHGMRVVGPNSFGLANTSPEVALNASLSPFLPDPGSIGLFSQSGALGTTLLAVAQMRGLGISTFVSAGNRADLSGNDVLQYWEEDPETALVALYLESIGNPRKFSRIARRVSRVKPVIVVKSDLTGRELPPGHQVRLSSLSTGALDQVLGQAGVVRVSTIHELFDVAQVFTSQPLPGGRRVGVIGNSAALNTLIMQRARSEGLHVTSTPVSMHPEVGVGEFSQRLAAMFAESELDSVIVSFTPSVGAEESEIAAALASIAARSDKTTVACFLGVHGVKDALTAYVTDTEGHYAAHTVPSYIGPEDAVSALARATEYSLWKTGEHGRYPELTDVDRRAASRTIEKELTGVEPGEIVELGRHTVRELLATYGIECLPYYPSHNVEEALVAARTLGYPVALKAVHKQLRHRVELGAVRLNVSDDEELVEEWNAARAIIDELDEDTDRGIDVQAMAPPGTPCIVLGGEDPLLGPMVSFGLAGDASDLLEDVAHRVAPLTDADAKEMVRSPKASPRLFGYKGLPVANVAPLEDVLLRVSELVDDHPQVRGVEVRPIVATETEAHILSARIELTAAAQRIDSLRRRLS